MNVVPKINEPNYYFAFIGDREYAFSYENGKVIGFFNDNIKQRIEEYLSDNIV